MCTLCHNLKFLNELIEYTFNIPWEDNFETKTLYLAKLSVKLEDRVKPFLHL